MEWLTEEIKQKLIENGQIIKEAKTAEEVDLFPVIFLAYNNAKWLLVSIDPEHQDIAYGLCDLGVGMPEMGCVNLQELSELKNEYGVGVHKGSMWDHCYKRKISKYLQDAKILRTIVLELR